MSRNTKHMPAVSDALRRSNRRVPAIGTYSGLVSLSVVVGAGLTALVAISGVVDKAAAQASSSRPVAIVSPPASDVPAPDWTVLTVAPDGSWGVATEADSGRAIARAIANCKKTAKTAIGCGASLAIIRAGWSLAIRCGGENIVVAEQTLADAEKAALGRENELRASYVPDLPACTRVLTVDPHGAVATADGVLGSAGASPLEAGLRRGSPPRSVRRDRASEIPAWKTITLGTYRNVNALREALDTPNCGAGHLIEIAGPSPVAADRQAPGAQPCRLGVAASEIIGRPAFTLSKTKTNVDLVVLSVAELGFADEEEPSLQDVYARAQLLGLALCPAEVGPQLRLQYLDQAVGESIRIAMQPIAQYDGRLVGLEVANGGAGLLLVGGDARADAAVPASARFVFVRPR